MNTISKIQLMKKTILIAAFICSISISVNAQTKKSVEREHPAKEVKAALYACSMHPEITSLKADKCSKCGMNLVKKKVETTSYICPMKCEGSESKNPGKCPKCGMDLVKKEEKTMQKDDHKGHHH